MRHYYDFIVFLAFRTLLNYEDKSFSIDCYNDRDDKLICGELLGFHDCPKCLDIIGANSIKKTATAIVNDEKKIEKIYKEFIGTGLETNIQKLLNISNYKLALIGNLPDKKMQCYHRLFLSLSTIDNDSDESNIDLYSEDLMENDEFYKLNEQYNDLLAKYGYIKAIYCNYAFYLNFINNIDKYIEIHGDNEDLNDSKNRLLYLLDGYGDNLFIKENYNNSYNNISMDDINYKDDLYDFYTLSRLFLVDILEG